MTRLLWDQVGERQYETGLDRGVLYPPGVAGIAWNGLTSVDEILSGERGDSFYLDGIKYAESQKVSDLKASVSAITYPDEFLEFEGDETLGDGFYVSDQRRNRFGLCYRTLVGDDVDGTEAGYQIHILYNLSAVPAARNHGTIAAQAAAMEFDWSVAGIPEPVTGYKPTAHAILDSRYMNRFLLEELEDMLYGTDVTDPELPSLESLLDYVMTDTTMVIVDNGDGTWTATGPDELFSELYAGDPTTFKIEEANAIYLDSETYQVSTY